MMATGRLVKLVIGRWNRVATEHALDDGGGEPRCRFSAGLSCLFASMTLREMLKRKPFTVQCRARISHLQGARAI